MIYLDASVVVASLVREIHTDKIVDWMSRQEGGVLLASAWVDTEVASALSLKVRTGALSTKSQAEAAGEWRLLLKNSIRLLSVTDEAFALATAYCSRPQLTLRSGDALHLAIALLGKAPIATLDKKMLVAARALDVAALNPAEENA